MFYLIYITAIDHGNNFVYVYEVSIRTAGRGATCQSNRLLIYCIPFSAKHGIETETL